MRTLTKGALTIATSETGEKDVSLQDKIEEMFNTARRLKDAHGELLPRNFEDDKPERVCAYILEEGVNQISKILTVIPAEYKPRVEQALLAAVNAGQALEAMDIHGEHGPKIEGKQKSDGALADVNEQKKYTEEEIQNVRKLYYSLKGQFTQAAPLHREIAECIKDRKMTNRVVRNIIERYILKKPRSKSRGRRK